MRMRRVGTWLALSAVVLLFAGSSVASADEGREKVLDLRTRSANGDHAVVFFARFGSVGHAVVAVGHRDDAQGLHETEAFGLFPREGVLGLESAYVGPAPAEVVRELISSRNQMPVVYRLLCQVDESTWRAVDDIRKRWVRKTGPGLLEDDAGRFVSEVADALGLQATPWEPGLGPPTFVRGLIERGAALPRRPAGARPAPAVPAAPGIELPRVGTLGQSPTGDGVIVLTVTGDGRMSVGDQGPLSLIGLRNLFIRLTADPEWREPDRSSKKILLVNADASLPWVVGQWIMQSAADPRVGIYRIFFGARPRETDEPGAIGWTLPKDRGLQLGGFVEEEPHVTVKLSAKEGVPRSDPEALLPRLRAMRARLGGDDAVVFEIKAPRPGGMAVPTGFVLQVVDVARRAGFAQIRFEGAAAPISERGKVDDPALITELVTKIKAAGGTPYIRIGDERVGEWPEGDPRPAVQGRLPTPYGFGIAPTAEWIAPPVQPEGFFEEELEEPSGSEEGPFEGPSDNGSIGIGGGAGGAFRGRGRRDLGAASRRGKAAVAAAVEDALLWLAAHQSPDGSWDADGFGRYCDGKPALRGPDGEGEAVYDAGVTGLALCAFLGQGYTNRGRHPFAKVVGRGLRYLKTVQDAEGCFGPRTSQHFIYNHAVAALAMVEAYGMTQSPIFKGSAQRALDFIALSRNPYFAWRYGVKPGDNDTSVTGWMTMALYAARLTNEDAVKRGKPAPLRIDEEAFDGVRNWIDKMTDPATGRAGYILRGGTPARPQALVDRFPADVSESMTAVAILARVVTGEDPRESEIVQKGAALCAARPPVWNSASGEIDMYYWYYATMALFQVGGKTWRDWNRKLVEALVSQQRQDTSHCMYKGSWDPIGPWGLNGGRVYATALLAMCLETPRRYASVVGAR